MNIVGLGLDANRKLLFQPQPESAVSDALVDGLERNSSAVRSLTRTTADTATFRQEATRKTIDPGDPQAAGWTFLVNAEDPQLDSIMEIVRPLADHRGMADSSRPLTYRDEARDEWFDWLHDEYYSLALDGRRAPQYVLIVGGPGKIPFGFQSVLGTVANVGRVDFESLDDLSVYVEKLLRLDTAREPAVDREALFFAPDGGFHDPTYFSRRHMAEPLAAHVRDTLGVTTHAIVGEDATKEVLLSALASRRPALIYTASHGLGAIDDSFDKQRRMNGAICCQSEGGLTADSLFGADDVVYGEPFLEGSVFFQFACFSYGTPAESDYAHWIGGIRKRYTEQDFVAALPKRLLAHPRGPIAYVGHLDTAFLHAFTDAEAPHILDRWNNRVAPFVNAVDQLLALQPSGLAMQDMSVRYSVCNALITSVSDRQRRGRFKWTPEAKAQFLDRWITRGDAQNYMVFGDPAARLRLPA